MLRRIFSRLTRSVHCCLASGLLLLAASAALAQAPAAALSAATTHLNLIGQAAYFADDSGTLDATAALQAWRAGRFTPAQGKTPNLGLSRATIWLAVDVSSTPNTPRGWLLVVDYPPLDRIEVYQPTGDTAGAAVAVLGDHLPQSARPLPGRPHAAALTLRPGARHTLLLRVDSSSTKTIPLDLWQAAAFVEQESNSRTLHGVYAGLMLTLLLYALFTFARLRDSAYLFYAGYIATFGLCLLSFHGVSGWYLWPEGVRWNNHAAPVLLLLAVFFGAQCSRRLLYLSAASPRIDVALNLVAWFALALAAAGWFGLTGLRELTIAALLTGLLDVALMVAGSFSSIGYGHAPARIFLASKAPFIIAAFIGALRNFGLLPSSVFTHYSLQIASMFEVMLLAYALADRLRQYQAQTGEAQSEALRAKDALLDSVRQHERELDQRVRERTLELSSANALLQQRETELRDLALKDPLTGLANRRQFDDRLSSELARARRDGKHCVLYLLDLDGFKLVNDRLGHAAGDALLRKFAERLNDTVRASDLVARLGGDEFVVLACGLDSADDAGVLAAKIITLAQMPFSIAQTGTGQSGAPRQAQVGASIGYAVFPDDAGEESALLRHADQAMYAAKEAGKGVARRYAGAGLQQPVTGPV